MKSIMSFIMVAVVFCGVYSSVTEAGIVFNSVFDSTQPYVTLEGRMSFYSTEPPYSAKNYYLKWMEEGKDEIGLFMKVGILNICIGTTSEVGDYFGSHYTGLKVNSSYLTEFLGKHGTLPSDRFYVQAYNSSTKTIWDHTWELYYSFGLWDFGGSKYHLDVNANYNTGQIPEPATLLLLGVGSLILARRKK